MGASREQLIAVYARNTVPEIDAKPDAIVEAFDDRSLDELSHDVDFSTDQEMVREIKRQIERVTRDREATGQTEIGALGVDEQIRECLRMLLDFAESAFDTYSRALACERIGVMRDLLFNMYGKGGAGKKWDQTKRHHFDFLTEKIKSWHNCFVSYTNKNSRIVNNAYRKVIKVFVPKEKRKRLEREESNALAEAIVQGLRREQITRCFYDKENIKTGDTLSEEIGPACAQTFNFVQLVQRELFDRHARENWCFTEYQSFKRDERAILGQHRHYAAVLGKRLKPVLAGTHEGVEPAGEIRLEHRAWLSQVLDKKRFLPLPTEVEAFDRAIHQLAGEIVSLKRQLIDSVPT